MQNAPLYATSNQMQRRDAAVALAAHLPSMTWEEEEEILDVGCGSGDVTSSLLYPAIPVRCRVTGCDVSQEMVQYARENHQADNIHFSHLDIASPAQPRLTFPAGFHKIFSLYCLHWVRDLPTAIRNIHTLLLEGGQSLLIFLASNPVFRMYRILAANVKWAQYMKVGGRRRKEGMVLSKY